MGKKFTIDTYLEEREWKNALRNENQGDLWNERASAIQNYGHVYIKQDP